MKCFLVILYISISNIEWLLRYIQKHQMRYCPVVKNYQSLVINLLGFFLHTQEGSKDASKIIVSGKAIELDNINHVDISS